MEVTATGSVVFDFCNVSDCGSQKNLRRETRGLHHLSLHCTVDENRMSHIVQGVLRSDGH